MIFCPASKALNFAAATAFLKSSWLTLPDATDLRVFMTSSLADRTWLGFPEIDIWSKPASEYVLWEVFMFACGKAAVARASREKPGDHLIDDSPPNKAARTDISGL